MAQADAAFSQHQIFDRYPCFIWADPEGRGVFRKIKDEPGLVMGRCVGRECVVDAPNDLHQQMLAVWACGATILHLFPTSIYAQTPRADSNATWEAFFREKSEPQIEGLAAKSAAPCLLLLPSICPATFLLDVKPCMGRKIGRRAIAGVGYPKRTSNAGPFSSKTSAPPPKPISSIRIHAL
jgi:hypothetical protein